MAAVDDPELEPKPRGPNALEQVRPKLDRIKKVDLLPVNVDPVRALTTVQGVAARLQPLREQMLRLPDFNIEHFDNLELYARALMQANSLYACAKAPPVELENVAEEANRLKEAFICDVASLVKRGFLRDNRSKAAQGRPGYIDLASDLLTLANILRMYMEEGSTRGTASFEELDRAEVLADRLIALLGAREQAPNELDATTLDRQKAYTLMAHSYDQVRKAVAYLRWDTNDASELAPALNHGRKRANAPRVDPNDDPVLH